MTMRITYLQDHDGHKVGKNYFVERTLAQRLCKNGKALPFVVAEAKKIETAALFDKTEIKIEKAVSVVSHEKKKAGRPKQKKEV